MLILLAVIGIVGLFAARRYGVTAMLRTVNQTLGIVRIVRSTQRTRKGPARMVSPKVLGFSKGS